ncbi:MAG TPA: trypsin-like peptidase domain-containing protein [Pirellulales bacterium]|jgi:S1-C subfamily serine protease|nr:trypsin-like peptidase domain-containing protein [Pirellulales bacterium]
MDSFNNPAPPQRPAGPPTERSDRMPSRLPFLLLLLLGVIVLAFLPALLGQIEYARTKKEVQALQESLPALNLKSLSKAFTLVYRKVKPSVVHVDTRRELRAQRNGFGQFFNGGPRSYAEEGEASGFVVDPDGYILTNLHVVENATAVTVTLEDGRAHPAEVYGVEPGFDLAVLKIDAAGLTPVTWGDSDQLEVGEMVWAIGNPFGLDQTITAGIVSAKGRDIGDSPIKDFLQTDVAVNPGSSGGPLVDVNGDVVGVNSAIFGRTYQGISFAIPSNVAKTIYEKIRNNAKVISGYLGVGLAPVTPATIAQLRLQVPAGQTTGAAVVAVTGGSPAEKAGIEPGDVIMQWNGLPVTEENEFKMMVARTEVGTKVPVKIIRDGKEQTLEVNVVERPAQLLQ